MSAEHIWQKMPSGKALNMYLLAQIKLTSLSRTQNWLCPSPSSPTLWIPGILNIACLAMLSTPNPALNSEEVLELTKQNFDKQQIIWNILRKMCNHVKRITYLPAPTTTIFCLVKSVRGRPCALTAPSRPARATPAVPYQIGRDQQIII
jgi:hypothetical protein